MQGSIRWMAMSLILSGTIWGQAASAGQSTPQATAPTAAATTVAVAPSGGTITGIVKAGTIPLPGVGVTATNTLTGKKYATTTDVNGSFAMAVPRNGRYVVKAELAAFATETKEILINAARRERRQTGTGSGLRSAVGLKSPGAGSSGSGHNKCWSCAGSTGPQCYRRCVRDSRRNRDPDL